MSKKTKPAFRKRHLFARSVEDVVREATKPLMHQQGKLHTALLRDWEKIVGASRARVSRPDRLQFPATEAAGATLHLLVRPATAPELMYETEQILEQCARYFGYRAIERIVIHASYDLANDVEQISKAPVATVREKVTLPTSQMSRIPNEMRAVLERLAQHVSASDKKK